MTVDSRPTTLPLGNDIDLWIRGAKVRAVKSDALSFRGYVGATREATAAIDPALEAPAVAVGDGSGDYLAALDGASARLPLTPSLGSAVWLIAESVPPGAYRDAFAVVVVPDQGG